jgi:hypothetical protein
VNIPGTMTVRLWIERTLAAISNAAMAVLEFFR